MKKSLIVWLAFSALIVSCDFIKKQGNQNKQEVAEEFYDARRAAEAETSSTIQNDKAKVTMMEIPAPLKNRPEQIIKRKGYTVSYNKSIKVPNWVAWHLVKSHCYGSNQRSQLMFEEDTDVPNPRATDNDYYNSRYDRGHMCPGGDCNWDDKGRDETYVLSNMCPQNPNLNRGDWKEIENACRKWAQKYGSIYIVCGPMFFKSQKHERIGPNQIPIPEAFFKVVLCVDEYAPKGIGFICRNTDGNRTKDFYVNSIRQVERITGYKFFPNLNDSIMNLVYDMDDINVW